MDLACSPGRRLVLQQGAEDTLWWEWGAGRWEGQTGRFGDGSGRVIVRQDRATPTYPRNARDSEARLRHHLGRIRRVWCSSLRYNAK